MKIRSAYGWPLSRTIRLLPALIAGIQLAQAQPTFEVASVRRSDPRSVAASAASLWVDRLPECSAYRIQTDHGRFILTNVTVYQLILWAYGVKHSCFVVDQGGFISGGPLWVRTDRFDIQATIPANAPEYTPQQLRDAGAPELQAMIRSLLAERFKLLLHREGKDMEFYELAIAPGGPKLAAADPDKPKKDTATVDTDENKEILLHEVANKESLTDLSHSLETLTDTPVIDRTALTREFSFDIKFAVLDPNCERIGSAPCATGPSVFAVLQNQLGLQLTLERGPLVTLRIDSAAPPSGN